MLHANSGRAACPNSEHGWDQRALRDYSIHLQASGLMPQTFCLCHPITRPSPCYCFLLHVILKSTNQRAAASPGNQRGVCRELPLLLHGAGLAALPCPQAPTIGLGMEWCRRSTHSCPGMWGHSVVTPAQLGYTSALTVNNSFLGTQTKGIQCDKALTHFPHPALKNIR